MANPRYSETTIGSLQDLGHIIREQGRASGLRIDDAAALCGVSVDVPQIDAAREGSDPPMGWGKNGNSEDKGDARPLPPIGGPAAQT